MVPTPGKVEKRGIFLPEAGTAKDAPGCAGG